MSKKKEFHILLFWTCVSLLTTTILVACIYPFKEGKFQSVCRAYPSEYAAWQYAPPGRLDSEHRWVDNCNDAELFHKAYAVIWEQYNTDTTTWCVVCDELPPCPEQFKTCP